MDKICIYCGIRYNATRSDQLYCNKHCRYKDNHRGPFVLTLKKKWYDMIISGKKTEEYREIKEYWDSRFTRLFGKYYNTNDEKLDDGTIPTWLWSRQPRDILFKNGYRKDSPSFTAECVIREGFGKPEWGADKDKRYFILEIKRIYRSN